MEALLSALNLITNSLSGFLSICSIFSPDSSLFTVPPKPVAYTDKIETKVIIQLSSVITGIIIIKMFFHPDNMLTFKMSASVFLYSGQFIISTQLIKPNYNANPIKAVLQLL